MNESLKIYLQILCWFFLGGVYFAKGKLALLLFGGIVMVAYFIIIEIIKSIRHAKLKNQLQGEMRWP